MEVDGFLLVFAMIFGNTDCGVNGSEMGVVFKAVLPLFSPLVSIVKTLRDAKSIY